MNMLFRHKVHVLYRKEELDHERLEGKVAIVLDVLFATSTIITALANGATEVIPTLDEAGARAEAQKHPPGSYILAGELYAETLPGFESVQRWAILGPAGMAQELVAKLNRDLTAALNDDDVKSSFAAQGAKGLGGTPAELAAFMKTDYDKWGNVVRDAGIRPE